MLFLVRTSRHVAPCGTSHHFAEPHGTCHHVAEPLVTSQQVAEPRGTSHYVAAPRGTNMRQQYFGRIRLIQFYTVRNTAYLLIIYFFLP